MTGGKFNQDYGIGEIKKGSSNPFHAKIAKFKTREGCRIAI
jgi:hypothetical protein